MTFPHFDFTDAEDSPITVGELLRKLGEYAEDWVIEVNLAGDKVIHLSLNAEDIHADKGKVTFVVGADQEIHVWPLDLDIGEPGDET